MTFSDIMDTDQYEKKLREEIEELFCNVDDVRNWLLALVQKTLWEDQKDRVERLLNRSPFCRATTFLQGSDLIDMGETGPDQDDIWLLLMLQQAQQSEDHKEILRRLLADRLFRTPAAFLPWHYNDSTRPPEGEDLLLVGQVGQEKQYLTSAHYISGSDEFFVYVTGEKMPAEEFVAWISFADLQPDKEEAEDAENMGE